MSLILNQLVFIDTPAAAEDGSSEDLKKIGCKRKVVKLILIIILGCDSKCH